MREFILAGDVGGTKTHLALFSRENPRLPIIEEKFKSPDFSGLLHIVLHFLKKVPVDGVVTTACFGLAGTVVGRLCKTTNLPWEVDADQIEKETKIKAVSLINDLQANAYGISCLQADEFFCLNYGQSRPGNRALISAGTGLGEAGLYWDGERHCPFATEGGHCSFSPANDLETQLLIYLTNLFGHVSFERILSGPGLYNLYRFIIEEGFEKEEEEVKNAFHIQDPSQVITLMGMHKRCRACEKALDLFVSIYGGEAANLTLKMLAVGGLYIGGGIAPKILPALKEGLFMERFVQKGRYAPFLKEVPVNIILNENTALLGAVSFLLT